jgi:hypothetical protein
MSIYKTRSLDSFPEDLEEGTVNDELYTSSRAKESIKGIADRHDTEPNIFPTFRPGAQVSESKLS